MVDASNSKADSYVVVARRYRPQTFDELIGQEHVARGLKGAITANRVGHAYLFTGARGVGKTSAARILAKALNCEKGPTPTPCNECDLCESITSGEDVDVLEIDGASNRGIDEIRELRQNAAVRPSRCRYKIYIIDEVHMLTGPAFNALLKTLEEPPEHVKFIFATTEPQKVPVTILSRCQRFDFAGIAMRSIEARLADIAKIEGVEAEPEALAILARRAAGSMRDGQSLLEQILSIGEEKVTTDAVTNLLGIATTARIGLIADQLLARDAAGALAELDAAVVEGTDVGMLLEQLLGFFRDVMLLAVGGSDEQMRFAMPSQAEKIREAAKKSGIETLLAMMQVLDQAVGRMRMSVDVRTLAEMALVRISRLEDLDDMAGAIAELRGQPATQARGGIKKNGRAGGSGSRTEQAVTPAARMSTVLQPNKELVREPVALTAENVDDVWRRAVGIVGGMLEGNAALASRVEVPSQNCLVATFDEKYTACKEFCEQLDQRERLVAALAKVAGQPIQLTMVLKKAGENQERVPTAQKSRREMRREIGEHPFVQRAAELFGADTEQLKYTPPES